MSVDLHQMFAEAGLDGPAQRLDCDYIVRRGRRARVRRRAAAGATVLVGAGVVVLAGTTVVQDLSHPVAPEATTAARSGATPSPTTASPVATPSPTTATASSATATPISSANPSDSASVEAALAGVSLPEPAPGFPYRRQPDDGPILIAFGSGGEKYWMRRFFLASEMPGSNAPAGPEATMLVGTFPIPQPESVTIDGKEVVTHPQVAGVVGTAITQQRNGTPTTSLYFYAGGFSVEIDGTGGVTTEQLVALGNALTGLA